MSVNASILYKSDMYSNLWKFQVISLCHFTETETSENAVEIICILSYVERDYRPMILSDLLFCLHII